MRLGKLGMCANGPRIMLGETALRSVVAMCGFANAWNGTIVIVYVGKLGVLGWSGFTLHRRGRRVGFLRS